MYVLVRVMDSDFEKELSCVFEGVSVFTSVWVCVVVTASDSDSVNEIEGVSVFTSVGLRDCVFWTVSESVSV